MRIKKIAKWGVWSGEIKIKAQLIPAELELGMSLAKAAKDIDRVLSWYYISVKNRPTCTGSVSH